ncbi:hypothetical protein GP486_003706 [Trichoglossum hirsutum]|uniref:RNA-dependent RNA polymerase n=1 Tax=Trichoglossum hirsutum TaxID=265104 RepID=A0A9P8LCL5_9PEZI|nr:hypothetical protein GP486_003706 [Trichoglossum hirsutum]
MDIFIRGLPDQISERQLIKSFGPVLAKCSIQTFYCQRLRGRGLATLTVADEGQGLAFLKLYGWNPVLPARVTVLGRTVLCSTSKYSPEPLMIQSLKKEEADKLRRNMVKKPAVERSGQPEGGFGFRSLSCGLWDYNDSDLVFVSHFWDSSEGTVMFGIKSMTLLLCPINMLLPTFRIDIPYSSVDTITTGDQSNPSVTITLAEAPRMFESTGGLSGMTLQNRQRKPSRKRVTSISNAHGSIVGSCFVYQITLLDSNNVSRVSALLKRHREMLRSISLPTKTILCPPGGSFRQGMTQLDLKLGKHQALPFGLKFQIQKLAQNGYLPPTKVTSLLPRLSLIFDRSGGTIAVRAVRRLFNQIPFAGPATEATQLGVEALEDLLEENEKSCRREISYMPNLAEKHQHIALIHAAKVTPAGIYLEGPETETKNRVLRKYSKYMDYFLRVSFVEEDGETIRFDRNASLEEIFHGRFKRVLGGNITIAGRPFEFLGFSHSSLRSQTCWFMAPFTCNGELLHARLVIKGLGDFSEIRSPAKCAARIGQAFSETFSTVNVPQGAVKRIPDVKRINRVFSDGVGTISQTILQKIWNGYALSQELKPTLFQIRFAGAKGMISLDNRLKGDVLNLRPSMEKFPAKELDIEICGAAFHPLPLYLNRQTIKILEDLGVEHDIFLELQARAVEKLRRTTLSPINAANFLERNTVGRGARLPLLIERLNDLRLSFSEDYFLRSAVELAVLYQLRELKHRSRILVEEGYTLYGIMDETNFLEEGEIYCVIETEKDGRSVIVGDVTVTRAPALHPGDIQVAKAVNVPGDSPLNALHNCVVFSQKGKRDLPSQLSGGDLDGDLYNIIEHPRLRPKFIHEPADYPPVRPIEITEGVKREDITGFFIEFMENDQLGRIATLHQTLADQKPKGTLDPSCIVLANMHSTAVDFSKSGIRVDMTKCPRYNMCRPDFMATGPRVKVEKNIELCGQQLSDEADEEDIIRDLDPDGKGYRYYESKKVLGKLYRAIDERSFFSNLQEQSERLIRANAPTETIMGRLWGYIQRVTNPIQWRHHRELARDIKDTYEDCLNDIRSQYSSHPTRPLSELEVFVGTIIGKNGIPNKRQREFSTDMKERFNRDVSFVVDCIIKDNDGGAKSEEALERSIACLAVAMEDEMKPGTLVSFKYVAAAVCLKEIEGILGSSIFWPNY